MRSKEAITAMVIGAAALAAQPGLMAPRHDDAFVPFGSVPPLCLGTCTATAVSGSSTSTPLQSLRQNDCFKSNNFLSDCLPGVCNDSIPGRAPLLSAHAFCTDLDDSTSPLSASSRVGIGGAPTPSGSEALSGPRLAGKRNYEQAFEHQQLHNQQQVLQRDAQKTQLAVALRQTQLQQAQLLLAQQQQQLQATACLQPAALQRQKVAICQQQSEQQQQHRQEQSSSQPIAELVGHVRQHGRLSAVGLQQQLVQPKQQLLVSQNSSASSTSSGASFASCLAASGIGAAPQQCSQHHEQQKFMSSLVGNGVCIQQQQQAWLLRPVSTAVVTAKAEVISSANNSSWTSYLQRLQEQNLQPPCKRAAINAAYATTAAFVRGQQQQLPAAAVQALAAVRAPTHHSSSARLAAGVPPALYLLQAPASHDSQLLGWAGQLLNCQLSDAYYLAQHIYKRAAVLLDDMLLITLGVTQPMDKVTMLVSLWMATKLEGHRRQVVGCSKLASALHMVPWAVTSVELHVMQALEWRPYAGFAGRTSCAVNEL